MALPYLYRPFYGEARLINLVFNRDVLWKRYVTVGCINRRTLAILAERCGSADSTTCLLLFVYIWLLFIRITKNISFSQIKYSNNAWLTPRPRVFLWSIFYKQLISKGSNLIGCFSVMKFRAQVTSAV